MVPPTAQKPNKFREQFGSGISIGILDLKITGPDEQCPLGWRGRRLATGPMGKSRRHFQGESTATVGLSFFCWAFRQATPPLTRGVQWRVPRQKPIFEGDRNLGSLVIQTLIGKKAPFAALS